MPLLRYYYLTTAAVTLQMRLPRPLRFALWHCLEWISLAVAVGWAEDRGSTRYQISLPIAGKGVSLTDARFLSSRMQIHDNYLGQQC